MDIHTARMVQIGLLEKSLLSLDRVGAINMLHDANIKQSPVATIEELVAPTLTRIGQSWEAGQVSLAQLYMSGRICEEIGYWLRFPNC